MHYQIKRGSEPNVTIVADVRPEGVYARRIMGDLNVTFNFSDPAYFAFQLGDYVEVFGEKHYLNRAPVVKRVSNHFEYSLIFETIAYDLLKPAYLMLGDDNSFKEPILSLHATAEGFLRHLINNANRVQSGWQIGMVDSTEARTMTFSGENCLNVLTRVAAEFNTEFWIDNQIIHLTKRGFITDQVFEYGQGKGLYEITRGPKDGTNVFTRLYAYGSQKNLLREYRNFSNNLLLPLENGPYLEDNVAEYGVIEHVVYFDDIFPRRESTVTYTSGLLSFTDSTMDFDLNSYLLPGETAKVTFNSGQLAGFEFEITSYNHDTKTFTFKRNDEESIPFPNETLKAAFGDKYVLTDIFMPQTYVDAAEKELLARATEYLRQNSVPRVMYQVQCDEIDFKRKGIYVGLGTFVKIIDTAMGVDSMLRVIGLTRDISKKFQYTLELSESFTIPQILRQYAQQDKVNKFIDAQSKPTTSTAFVPKWYPLYLGPGFSTVDVNHATINRAEYLKDSLGFVHLRGRLNYDGSGTQIAFTLATEHRPYKRHFQMCTELLNLDNKSRLTVYPNGSAYFITSSTAGASVLLDGISFLAEKGAEVVTEPEQPQEPQQPATPPVLSLVYFDSTETPTHLTVVYRLKSDKLPESSLTAKLEEMDEVVTSIDRTFPVNANPLDGFYYINFTRYYEKSEFPRPIDVSLFSNTGYTVGSENIVSVLVPRL